MDKILDRQHVVQVLKEVKSALKDLDAVKLKELSNQTIHCGTCNQDSGSLTLAVISYALNKIIEREDYKKIKNWSNVSQKLSSYLDLAIKAAQEDNLNAFQEHILRARKTLTTASINLKPYLEEILKKAAINKASKLYEHGLSLGQTSRLLGVSQWELAEYTSQSKSADILPKAVSIKQRAKMALEFFS
ncbi:MAG: hypothetical protein AABW80_02980 [Nanoarchaeota archaeon]